MSITVKKMCQINPLQNETLKKECVLGGAKRILGCSSKTCNEAVRGDMGLESLRGRRDRAKLISINA